MSELTREKKCQIAALAAKGWKAEGIAEIAEIDIDTVKAFIATHPKPQQAQTQEDKKHGGHNKVSDEAADKVIELKKQGLSNAKVAEAIGIGQATVFRIWKNYKEDHKPTQINEDFDKAVNEMITEAKKEPAPAATDTDSMKNEIKHISTNNDTIDLAVCQDALERAVRGYLGIYEQMTESEQRAWELGKAFAELARARGLFV